jgi:hypothetical protein
MRQIGNCTHIAPDDPVVIVEIPPLRKPRIKRL